MNDNKRAVSSAINQTASEGREIYSQCPCNSLLYNVTLKHALA